MKVRHLFEVRVGLNDPEMRDFYHQETPVGQKRNELYAVGWSAQSYEWYGDEGPETKRGRYKSKGDGGEIRYINVPSQETAQRLVEQLDTEYESGHFYDKTVYHEYGKEWYINEYHGAWMLPMKDVVSWKLEHLSPRVIDFGKH